MKRRIYGEELASSHRNVFNDMPLELMEDLSRGPPALFRTGLACDGSAPRRARFCAAKHRARRRRRSTAANYDSVDSIAEFFPPRGEKLGDPPPSPAPDPSIKRPATRLIFR